MLAIYADRERQLLHPFQGNICKLFLFESSMGAVRIIFYEKSFSGIYTTYEILNRMVHQIYCMNWVNILIL